MNALDLFCGAAGGWSLGLHRAGIETTAACEIDPWRREVFSRNFPKVRMYDDITALTANRLAKDGITNIDIIVGSPPCQDASLANQKGKGVEGERTGLFFEAIRLVSELRPHWAVFENVPGLRARGYDRIHDELENLGYSVRSYVVGAWHAGAPHRRNRVWIVANSKEEQVGGTGLSREETITIPADTYEAGLQTGQMDGSLRKEKASQQAQSGDSCALVQGWDQWNGGPPDLGRMDDGISALLASKRGLGRSCIAAYGDAVVPQIAELFGRAILSLANR